MRSIILTAMKWLGILYITFATLVGTTFMAWPLIVLLYNGMMAPAPMPVYLPNGFVYDRDRERHDGAPKAIYEKDQHYAGKPAVMGNVKDVMWHENTVYGFRLGPSNEPYYFVCTYGADCTDTQNLREQEFLRMLKAKGLPQYQSREARTYDQLLREQSKTYTGKGG